jgi:hypothetical protein
VAAYLQGVEQDYQQAPMTLNDIRDHEITEEEKLRLHRWGTLNALMDCLALLEQAGREGGAMPQAAMHQAVESWLAETSASQPSEGGRHEGYRACAEWLAEGLDRDALAAGLLQEAFAVWPRDAADYQRGYDAFLEKELQNPRAPYYSSSHVWMTAVDDLRTRVTCAGEQGQVLSHRIVRRAVKLLHMHPEHLAPYLAPADPSAGGRQVESTSADAVTKRPGSSLGAGIWRRIKRRY